MSLSIYTYSNPYEIHNEPYWESIKNCAHFCVSQTMVNGLATVYDYLRNGQLATVEELVKALYPRWFDTKTYIEQFALLTNILDSLKSKILGNKWEKVKQSLKFNKSAILDSIRLLREMGINFENIDISKLSEEQLYLLAIYKKILGADSNRIFGLQDVFSEKEIDEAIQRALSAKINDSIQKALSAKDEKRILNLKKKKIELIKTVDCSSIVIHGVHQFTPTILSMIAHMAQYKRVILLFNYQQQYKEIYQTWLDIYSCFDINIKSQFNNEFRPSNLLPASYMGNLLADALAKLANGDYEGTDSQLEKISVLKFDNITEFSAYVAKIYEKAKEKFDARQDEGESSPLSCMEEQFYSANNEVNDILKVYFPEQFGERHFLAYPIGRFFVAVTNMWDAKNGGIKIENLNDIAECLYSKVFPEKRIGSLITTFNATKNYYSKEQTLEGIITLLMKLKKQKLKIEKGQIEFAQQLKRLNYYSVTEDDLDELITAFTSLDYIIKLFYEDFEKEENDFKHFYDKIREFVEQQILPNEETETEFHDIILRLLARLNEIKEPEPPVKFSFECLKETMVYYLKQEKNNKESANWIVRDFQQIDGDVLKSASQKPEVVYHFACVSDGDMNVKQDDLFPWPLNLNFFEAACDLLDWKYQVYIKSRREFKHFKRYALIYGLEFNRCKYKLSYVKNCDDKENELYYLLRLLNAKQEECQYDATGAGNAYAIVPDWGVNRKKFDKTDAFRRRICAYRFGLETMIEGGVHYKDKFLQAKYLEILLINFARKNLVGEIATENVMNTVLGVELDKLSPYFVFLNESELTDIKMNAKNSIYRQVLQGGKIKKFPEISPKDEDAMRKKEEFIYLQLKNDNKEDVLKGKFDDLSESEQCTFKSKGLREEKYKYAVDIWCQWCADREICLEYYKSALEE